VAIEFGLVVVLLALAGLHLYWGLGGYWPGADGPSLSERVVGTRGRPPGFLACALVALALLAAAGVVVSAHAGPAFGRQSWIAYGGYACLILVFGLRGLASYLTPVFGYARGTPFYDLNRKYYSPLCVIIAVLLIVDYPSGFENLAQRLLPK
jgi:Protein of unknown function (DUF3995)